MTTYLASIPSPAQGVWHLGPLPLRAYALFIIIGIIVAISWGERRWVARGGQKGTVTDVAVFAVPFGLVGGRLYHVATDYHKYFGEGKDPLDALKIWNGGLGIWGAIALGGVGAWIACRRRGIGLPAMADSLAPGIVVGQAIGRIGNYFNQELYGAETTVPWGLEIYERVDPVTGMKDDLNGIAVDTATPLMTVHPTFLYELLWNLGVAALIVVADRKLRLGHGRVFALYVAGYTAGRFWIEMMRTDEATMVLGLRINVITSVVVFLGAVLYFVLAAKRGERETNVEPAPESELPEGSAEDAEGEKVSATAAPSAKEDSGEAGDRPAPDAEASTGAAGSTTPVAPATPVTEDPAKQKQPGE
ncbi:MULTISPECIES: prolipoprotein diacylglyceryl transferase [Actinosynnema]|uniref:prolipoprotein diacylglyceryl transferase n=1 Tax=Actinosynnema TaxID=40566 RepID=UPI0020A399B2|nr:prolipoprotein diacylglyceryl transferase [Actinosynnema pretiosum]